MKSLVLVVIGTGISWVWAVLSMCVKFHWSALELQVNTSLSLGVELVTYSTSTVMTSCWDRMLWVRLCWWWQMQTGYLRAFYKVIIVHWLPWGSMSMSSLWAALQTRYCSYCQLSGSWLFLEWGESHVFLWVETGAAQKQLLVGLVKGEGKGTYSLLMGRRPKASPHASVRETQNNLWVSGFASLPEVVGRSFH